MKQYVPNYTIVPTVLQKIIPINPAKGVYMIAYNDNKSANILKKYSENTLENKEILANLIEKSLGIQKNTLQIIAIKDYYWNIGTHYYEPLSKKFTDRDDFVEHIQNPQIGMVVVGEAVSRYQGWVEGALESVENVVSKKWIK